MKRLAAAADGRRRRSNSGHQGTYAASDDLFQLLCAVNALGLSNTTASEVGPASAEESLMSERSSSPMLSPASPSDVVGGAGSGGSGGRNNVVDAGRLLRRLQEQLAEQREREGDAGRRRRERLPCRPFPELSPASGPDFESFAIDLDDLMLNDAPHLIGNSATKGHRDLRSFMSSGTATGVSIGDGGSGSGVVQALCQRLLAVKFDRVVAFALSVHVMRSAYQPPPQQQQSSLRGGGGWGIRGRRRSILASAAKPEAAMQETWGGEGL